MILSNYLQDLFKTYQVEINDQLTDSEGRNVIQKRIKGYHKEFASLLPMMESNPEMVAIAFYGAFSFQSGPEIGKAIQLDPNDEDYPEWADIQPSLTLVPWALPLITQVLTDISGDRFLVITASLEYLRTKGGFEPLAEPESDLPEDQNLGEDADPEDLAEAGNAWMEEQGFDRHE